jgi:hypothetical protein
MIVDSDVRSVIANGKTSGQGESRLRVIYSHRPVAPATGWRQECIGSGRKSARPAEGDYSYRFLLLFGRTEAICLLGTNAALA